MAAMFKRKPRDGKKGIERYADLVQLVLDPDLTFVTAVCNACHVSKQAVILDSIVYIMEGQEQTIQIIKRGITQSIEQTCMFVPFANKRRAWVPAEASCACQLLGQGRARLAWLLPLLFFLFSCFFLLFRAVEYCYLFIFALLFCWRAAD